MLIRHKLNGQLAVVDDEYGKELVDSGFFVRTRKRGKAEPDEAPDEDTETETSDETEDSTDEE